MLAFIGRGIEYENQKFMLQHLELWLGEIGVFCAVLVSPLLKGCFGKGAEEGARRSGRPVC